jgi:C1A family cysteine protease
VYTTAGSPGASYGRRLDGCLAETRSPKDFTAVPNVSSLPPRVDLRPGCSPVEDQGQVGSCTANAIVGAVEYKRRKQGQQDDLSRLFVYFNARRMSGTEKEDCGARIAHAMAAFLAHGAPPESAWPYDPARVNVVPDDAAYDKATANAEVEYARLGGIEHIKGALAREQPVVFSISLPVRCWDEAAKNGVIPTPTESELAPVLTHHGQHAMLLVGYDNDQHFLHVRNSWGTQWGDQGYCRLSFDTFQRAMAVNTAWILGPLEASGAFSVTRPQPALTAPPVEGGVRDMASKLRSDIRGSVTKDMDDALKSIRERVNPPRREG